MDFIEQVSPHFSLTELTKSTTADRFGIDNSCPSQEIYNSLQALALNVLEPIRTRFGQYMVTSAYRNEAVNKAVGGALKSQHMWGEAADLEISGVDNYDIARWVVENVDFDQVILEFYTPGKPKSGWVHCSYRGKDRNRRNVLTINPHQTLNGLHP